MARTLQFEQESLPAETGRQARALGQALQALADGLNAAAAGGARARGVLQSLPATVQAAARPLQTALNPALGALGTLVRGAADGTVKKQPVKKAKKPGRNDPCPCGSGKKYKKCCGRFEED